MLVDNTPYFYHGLMRKYVVYFGSLFNDISIQRKDADNETVQELTVPIAYGPKQSFIARIEQDPDTNKSVAIQLPRMSFEITNFQYDSSRKLNTMTRLVKQSASYTNRYSSVWNPVPYNIQFSLSIYTRNTEDGLQILEQIIPYFTPEWTATVQVLPEMGISLDIPVVLGNVSMNDRYEVSLHEAGRRYIIHTLTFTMKSYFFGPATSTGGIIRKAIVDLYAKTVLRTADLNINSYISNFKDGDFVYQHNGKYRSASGTVRQANSSYVQVANVTGSFSTEFNLLSTQSNAIGEVLTVSSEDTPDEVITVRPTLLANGQPTSSIDDSIDLDLIQSTDNYGVNTSITTG